MINLVGTIDISNRLSVDYVNHPGPGQTPDVLERFINGSGMAADSTKSTTRPLTDYIPTKMNAFKTQPTARPWVEGLSRIG